MDQYLPFGITILTILSNAFGSTHIKEISDYYNLSVSPAPYTFSIWGLIYSALLYTTFKYHADINTITTPFGSIINLFIISSILNALWIQTWTNKNIIVSSLLLLLLASVLIIITYYLAKSSVNNTLIITFGIYAAWAFIASLLNLGMVIKDRKLLDETTFKYGFLAIITIIAFILKKFIRNTELKLVILGVFIWAVTGIILNGKDNKIFLIHILSILLSLI